MSTVSDLGRLLTTMEPVLAEGVFVFCHLPGGAGPPPGVPWLGSFREAEGLTLILRREDAERAGLRGEFESACITLTVYSDLAAVGLTAAVARALAEGGIPCNVVAAFHHDHLFIPRERAEDALAILHDLQRKALASSANV